jgi:uncharacterized LabA/DUF88 family protein
VQRGKTICFIDNSNILKGQIASGWKIDWQKFQKRLEAEGDIWQIYFFASESDSSSNAQLELYKKIKEELHWEVVTYSLGKRTIKCINCNQQDTVPTEKGVDVGLATRMLMLAFNKAYETALLASGDRDYLETVQFIKNMGLRVEIIGWRDSVSKELATESSKDVLYLDELKDEISLY